MAIGYCGTETFKMVKTACDKNRRILILNAKLNDTNSEQLSTFSTLKKLLEKVDDYNKKKILILEAILI